MLPSIARATARRLLRCAGLDTLTSSDQARRRTEKATLALERARAEHALCGQPARFIQEQVAGQTARIEQEQKHRIVAAAQLVDEGPFLSSAPTPVYSPDVTMEALARLAREDQLPRNVQPAALRWPPPPNFSATFATLTSPFDLRLVR